MICVPLAELTPGLTLGTPVYSVKGMLLLRAGEVLTAKHLQVFTNWGIQEVDVLTEEDRLLADAGVPTDVPVPPEMAAAIETRMIHRFRFTDPADPVIATLRRVVTVRMTRQVLIEAARRKATAGHAPARA